MRSNFKLQPSSFKLLYENQFGRGPTLELRLLSEYTTIPCRCYQSETSPLSQYSGRCSHAGVLDHDNMVSGPEMLLQHMLLLMWRVLSMTINKNGLFDQLFLHQEVLSQVLSAASLTFCPGLYEVITSFYAPDISFFKSLCSDIVQCWGVYVLVLEKVGAWTKFYIDPPPHLILVFNHVGMAMTELPVLVSIRTTYPILSQEPCRMDTRLCTRACSSGVQSLLLPTYPCSAYCSSPWRLCSLSCSGQ